MSLRSSLRHAAEMFVELPPEETPEKATELPSMIRPPSDARATRSTTEEDDLDRQLAQQRQAFESLSAGVKPAVSSAASPATIPSPAAAIATTVGSAPQTASSPPSAAPSFLPDGTLDYAALYAQAALPAAPFTAEQMRAMLQSLPADLPLSTRRQTVQITIDALGKSIGVTPASIVEDAARKRAALAAFTESLGKDVSEFAAAADFEIQLLTAQIEEKRKGVAAAQEKLTAVQTQCRAEAERLDEVVDFFGPG